MYDELGTFSTTSSTATIMSTIASIPLRAQPGTEFNYSMSTDVLGALVEKISGLQLGEYMEANIFKPLGMNDTGFEVPEDKLHRVAALFTPNRVTVQLPSQTKNFVPFEQQNYCRMKPVAHAGGAGLCSTVDDFAKFMSAIMNDGKAIGGQILEPSTIKLLLENQLPAELGDDPLTQSFGPAGKDLYFSLG